MKNKVIGLALIIGALLRVAADLPNYSIFIRGSAFLGLVLFVGSLLMMSCRGTDSMGHLCKKAKVFLVCGGLSFFIVDSVCVLGGFSQADVIIPGIAQALLPVLYASLLYSLVDTFEPRERQREVSRADITCQPYEAYGISEFAIASLVMGLLSFVQVFNAEKGAVAVAFGILALRGIASSGRLRGRGLAIAGLILGAISVILVATSLTGIFNLSSLRH
jgi:hypothetical protein